MFKKQLCYSILNVVNLCKRVKMNLKKTIYEILLSALIFTFVVNLIKGVVLPTNMMYLFLTLIVVAFAVVLHYSVLRFLTVKRSFLSEWISVSILVFIALYLLDLVMPEFRAEGYDLATQDLGFIVLASVTLTKFASMIVIAFLTGLFKSIFDLLER